MEKQLFYFTFKVNTNNLLKQDLIEVNKILKYLKILFFLVVFILVSGCASQRQLTRPVQTDPDPRAVDHFVDGVMYDDEQNFPAAMLAYHEALIYDPNGATYEISRFQIIDFWAMTEIM